MKLYIDRLKESKNYIIQCVKDHLSLLDDIDISIVKTDKGKPYIDNIDINFSVSHSDEYIALVFDINPVGIDIEKIRNRDYLSIARRYFSKEDIHLINEKGFLGFYELWTMKEAYSKLKGDNLNLRINKAEIEEQGYLINTIYDLSGYIISIVYT